VHVSDNKFSAEFISKNGIDMDSVTQAVEKINNYNITLINYQNNIMATKKELFESKAATLSDQTEQGGQCHIYRE